MLRTVFYMLRLPNLLIIALTFCMLRYLVFIPVYSANSIVPGMGSLNFIIMVCATMIIAVAGYIINDYFDVTTDRVNKPEKQYIGKQVTTGTALAIVILMSCMAIGLSGWLSFSMKSMWPGILLLTALVVAWWYATRLKRSFVWGNLAVACMSAGTLGMAWLLEWQVSDANAEAKLLVTKVVIAIGVFAFLLSLMREIVKDMEDVEGDKLGGCRSIPIVKGIIFTKTLLMIFTVFTFILLIIAQVSLVAFGKWAAVVWLTLAVEMPLIAFATALAKAQDKHDYHKASILLKMIMLGGIMTMAAGQF